mmetsp:Transcript_5351/g.19542  ORF Transcript_5351/g.19542 Transcript_5351/m.19542 type:complete len:201 (+) Transcript_5351:295-897(+)
MNPFRGAKFHASNDWTPGVLTVNIRRDIGVHASEEQRVSFPRLDADFVSRARARVRPQMLAIFRARKHRLTTFLDITQVHQHRAHALSTLLARLVDFIVKIIKVSSILLTSLVSEHLKTFAVRLGSFRPRRDSRFNRRNDVVLGVFEECPIRCAYFGRNRSSTLRVHHGGFLKLWLRQPNKVIAFGAREKSSVEFGVWRP